MIPKPGLGPMHPLVQEANLHVALMKIRRYWFLIGIVVGWFLHMLWSEVVK